MLKDGRINTQCFSRCAALVPFIANLLGMDEKDFLKKIIVNPKESELDEGDFFLGITGGEEIYDENGIEQYQDLLKYIPSNIHINIVDLFKLQLEEVAPYYIDLAYRPDAEYQFFEEKLMYFDGYGKEENSYFEECRENLQIYISELLGKQYLEYALSKKENMQYVPEMKKWESYRNGGFTFDLVKNTAIEQAERQIISIPQYTDKIIEKSEIVPAKQQKRNSRENIGNWDNRILEEEMRRATWIRKVDVNEKDAIDRMDITSQNEQYRNSGEIGGN